MQEQIQKLKKTIEKARELGVTADDTVAVVLREVVDLCVKTVGAAQTRDILSRLYGRVELLAAKDPGSRN